MPPSERVTVTLPAEIVRDIDRLERNRSRFILEAVRHELQRRLRAQLQRSLRNPHSESALVASEGLAEWARSLPAEESAGLLDDDTGTAVRWVPGTGWVEGGE